MSAVRQSAGVSAAGSAADPSGIPGDLHGALEEVNVPAYAVDRFGIIRWVNSAAKKLVGDVRGKQQSSVVVPEQAREAKESFLRKMMGTEKSTEGTVVVVGPDGERVQVEISSCALREGHRIVGVFGVVRHRDEVGSAATAPAPHAAPEPGPPPARARSLHLADRRGAPPERRHRPQPHPADAARARCALADRSARGRASRGDPPPRLTSVGA